MLKIRKLLYFVYFAFVFLSTAYSQNSVTVRDTTIDRDKYYNIPVIGTLVNGNVTELSIEFVFNSRVIDIQKAEGSPLFAIKEENPLLTIDYTNPDSAIATITSNNVSGISNGVICLLSIRGLVYSDSIAFINPINLLINGSNVEFNKETGHITVLGPSIYPDFPDYLGYGYPNPFNYQVRFDFSLEKSSSVTFELYNLAGLLVTNSEDDDNQIFRVFTSLNVPVNDLTSLNEGSYYLLLTPRNYIHASGYYILIMKVGKKVFNTNIIYNK